MDDSCRDDPALMTPDPPAGSPVTHVVTRLALSDHMVAAGVAALDDEAGADAPRVAEEGARLARGEGLGAVPQGSVSHGLLRRSTRPLLIVPPHEQDEHPS